LKWSKIDTILEGIQRDLTSVGDRIEAADKNKQQVYHANHKRYYVKRIGGVSRGLLLLRRRFSKSEPISRILHDFDDPMRILVPPRDGDLKRKAQEFVKAERLLEELQSEIRRKQEEEYDILPRDRVEIDRKLCFVVMPFTPHKDFDPVYTAIRRAARKHDLKCVRSDNVFDTRAIVLDIWDNIRRSKVCVADISTQYIPKDKVVCETKNANVFYELGWAHALPKRVILISRELRSDEKTVFDVYYVRCIYYRNTPQGLRELEKKISRTIRTALR
jgi:hypothetical protein